MDVPAFVPKLAFRLHRLWLTLRRPLTLGVRILVRNAEGHILLIRHTYIPGWSFPGGGVERGESLYDAAARELREEVSLQATDPLRLISVHFRQGPWGSDHVVLFEAPGWDGEVRCQPFEIAEARFFAPDALPPDITRSTAARLREFIDGLPAAERWQASPVVED